MCNIGYFQPGPEDDEEGDDDEDMYGNFDEEDDEDDEDDEDEEPRVVELDEKPKPAVKNAPAAAKKAPAKKEESEDEVSVVWPDLLLMPAID